VQQGSLNRGRGNENQKKIMNANAKNTHHFFFKNL